VKKILIVFLVVVSPVVAQDQRTTALAAAGCGPDEVEFSVKTDKKQHPAPQAEAGKALVYVFERVKTDDAGFAIFGVTTKVGLDGAWAGANSSNSYFFFSVEPGDHRVCTKWQSAVSERSKLASAASFSAGPGKIYYFRTSVRVFSDHNQRADIDLKLEPLDPAEAQILLADSALSRSHPKK